MDSFFQRALPYIERGWPVFPTRPDKRPLTEHGKNDASCIATVIEEWSERWPQANVSLVTGEISGIAVIDIDGERGEESFAKIQRTWDRLPDTAEAKSGRGRHLYFAWLPCKSADSKIAPGIDVKSNNGSITAPISQHASGKMYEWIRSPFNRRLPLLPLWVVRTCSDQPRQRQPYRPDTSKADVSGILNGVRNAPQGERNHKLNRAAFILGLMVKDGREREDSAFQMLMEAGLAAGLTRLECTATIKSGLRSGLTKT